MGTCYSQCSELGCIDPHTSTQQLQRIKLFDTEWESIDSPSVLENANSANTVTGSRSIQEYEDSILVLLRSRLIRCVIFSFLSAEDCVDVVNCCAEVRSMGGKDCIEKVLKRYFRHPDVVIQWMERAGVLQKEDLGVWRRIMVISRSLNLLPLFTEESAEQMIQMAATDISNLSDNKKFMQLQKIISEKTQLVQFLVNHFGYDDMFMDSVVRKFVESSVEIVIKGVQLCFLFGRRKAMVKSIALFRYKVLFAYFALSILKGPMESMRLFRRRLEQFHWIRFTSLPDKYREKLLNSIELPDESDNRHLSFWMNGRSYDTRLKKNPSPFTVPNFPSGKSDVIIFDNSEVHVTKLIEWSNFHYNNTLAQVLQSSWSARFVCSESIESLDALVQKARWVGLFELETVGLMFRSWVKDEEKSEKMRNVPGVQKYVKSRFTEDADTILGN